MQRRWIKVAIAAVVLLVAVAVAIPFFIDADTFRPKVEDQLSTSLGRKVSLGHLSLSLITGSLVADNISIADDPAFATTPFLQAKQLKIGIEVAPFLFHRLIRITALTVDTPEIQLIHSESGTWNFSSIGAASANPTPQKESVFPDLTVGEVKIKNGSATIFSAPASGKPFVCSGISLALKQFSFTKSFPFELSLKLPGDGAFELKGSAGPVSQSDAAQTPFNATLQLKHFDPVAAGVVEPGQGITMVADFNAQLVSDGANLTSTGKLVASKLQLARTGSPAPQPVAVDYEVSNNLATRTGKVKDLSIHTGSVAVHVNGSYRSASPAIVLDLHLSAPNLPIDQLEQLLPTVGVHLPSGSSLKGGTLSANLSVTGPLSATVIAGPVEIDNTQLSGFDLGSKIGGINPLKGTSGGTPIEKLSTDLRSSPQSTQFDKIYASVPQIGTASGSGSVAPSGALDFQLVAKLNNATPVGAVVNSGMNMISGFLGGGSSTASNNGIPLTITGTASNPSIHANIGAMFKQQTGGLFGKSSGQQKTKPGGVLKGLFGR
jgi:AsmA protein